MTLSEQASSPVLLDNKQTKMKQRAKSIHKTTIATNNNNDHYHDYILKHKNVIIMAFKQHNYY